MQTAVKIKQWASAHPLCTLILATLIALAPFLAKPFNMDDPLFVWSAHQIQAHPFDPYGFEVNWYGASMPMSDVTQNPPLAAYYMAIAADVLGWSETAMHLAFLLPALAVILATFRLAKRFCAHPLFAALVTLFCPVFLVSATTVMCDVLMLSFWMWALVFWLDGLERDDLMLLTTSASLVALAALTKYFGACLVPLLALEAWRVKRRLGFWLAALLIPVAALGLFQWLTRAAYHHAMMSEAAKYVQTVHGLFGAERAMDLFTAVVFAGGCVAPAVFMAPWLWPRKFLLITAAAATFVAIGFIFLTPLLDEFRKISAGDRAIMDVQVVFWAMGGAVVLALAVADWRRPHDSGTWLLGGWVIGTFIFTGIFNWTINGRSILPMAPAIAILLARRFQYLTPAQPSVFRPPILIATGVSALFTVWIAQADYLYATASRTAALYLREHYGQGPGRLWFEGHWGFQYYMQEAGGRAIDLEKSLIQASDFIAIPYNNSNLAELQAPADRLQFAGPTLLATMNINVGAAFYASVGGKLPFAFGAVPPETVVVYNHVQPQRKP